MKPRTLVQICSERHSDKPIKIQPFGSWASRYAHRWILREYHHVPCGITVDHLLVLRPRWELVVVLSADQYTSEIWEKDPRLGHFLTEQLWTVCEDAEDGFEPPSPLLS